MKHIGNMLAGLAIAWLAAMILCMIGAGLVAGGQIPESNTGYISAITLLLSTIMGAWTVKKRMDTYTWVWCLLFGLIYYISLLCVGTLLFEGQLSGGGVTLLVTLGSSAAVILVGNSKKNRMKLGRRAYKTRAFV